MIIYFKVFILLQLNVNSATYLFQSKMSHSDSGDEYDWKPPTEAEKKVLAARRERSDKVIGDRFLCLYMWLLSVIMIPMKII
jgi:hypothetical protein